MIRLTQLFLLISLLIVCSNSLHLNEKAKYKTIRENEIIEQQNRHSKIRSKLIDSQLMNEKKQREYIEPSNTQSAAASLGWTIDASKPLINVSPDLFGIFFEEINHAGYGGLYSNAISNSNFETLQSIYYPWTSINGARLTLDNRRPVTGESPHSLRVQSVGLPSGTTIGTSNPGFWGISVNHTSYHLSFFVRSDTIKTMTVSLVNGATVYATQEVDGLGRDWSRKNVDLKFDAVSDLAASFNFTFTTTGAADDSVYLDVVTAFPDDGWMGLRYVRADLGNLVAQMQPAFVRFPGGCYVEGDNLYNRFNWKNALGGLENRAGHWNLWGYWTEDGLGLFEFLSIIEKLKDPFGNPTRAIWVVNNGISHSQSLNPTEVQPYLEDAMDSIEFAMGDATTTEWGRRRAEMGHKDPFVISYMAIGNEDCGKQWYEENYQLFYDAISAKYPQIQLISNCEPRGFKQKRPVQVWDFHIYTTPESLSAGATTFDNQAFRREGAKIFNSEYAVTTGAGNGNLIAGLAESAWMTGLERNSDLVSTASYAPLFVNVDNRAWTPDAIVFNSEQAYGTPSYWNQVLWSQSFNGLVNGTVQTLSYALDQGGKNVTVAVSVGQAGSALQQAKAGANTVFIHKLVNIKADSQAFSISINNLPSGAKLNPTADVVTLAGTDPEQENSMANPTAITTVPSTMQVSGPQFSVTLPGWSTVVVRVYASTSMF